MHCTEVPDNNRKQSDCSGFQVVESTGLVMAPYLEYPQLLSVLLRMLNEGEGSPHIRREVLKVIAFSDL